MCSEKDGSSVPTPSSQPSSLAVPALPNAFDEAFLARLQELDEPPAAPEADGAGPWRLDHLPEGVLGLFRLGESRERGYRPFAQFQHRSDALLALAMMVCGREEAYRLRPVPESRGYAVQSRAAWGEAIGWLAVFDESLVDGLSWAESLMRSPEALSFFLEACGRTVLERAGAILEERLAALGG
jgi:hypothetical protein